MPDAIAKYQLTISQNEAKDGTERVITRNGRRLAVTIPAGIKTGSLVKLSGALQITDGYYGDIVIEINVKQQRYWKRQVKTFGFWSLVLGIPGVFLPVAGIPFFVTAVILGVLQFRRRVSKCSIAGFALGLAGVVFFIVVVVPAINYLSNPSDIFSNGIGVIGSDYKPIELVNNPNAVNPSYEELLIFIQEDTTDAKRYIDATYFGGYDCKDYAEDVHNNAEGAGIRAAWVGIDFRGEEIGHAINAFETTDRGLVYIDCTEWDTVAYVEKGKEYGSIDITEAYSPLYSFYDEYKQEGQGFEPLGIVESIYIHW